MINEAVYGNCSLAIAGLLTNESFWILLEMRIFALVEVFLNYNCL